MPSLSHIITSWRTFRHKRGGDPTAIAEDIDRLQTIMRREKVPKIAKFPSLRKLLPQLGSSDGRLLY